MNNLHQHPFHMVDQSPWPIMGAASTLMMTSGLVNWFQKNKTLTISMGFLSMMILVMLWWQNMIRESTFLGSHTSHMVKGVKTGFILFMMSELMFFVSFFWTFFHSALSPTPEMGMLWPPKSINPINPWTVPLLNTAILLSSGGSLTWSHYSLCHNKKQNAKLSLTLTIILGMWFTLLQVYEYWESSFTMADNIYGNTFFVATGFHGMHVMMGTTFLMVCLLRVFKNHFSAIHHMGYECAIWYWHFVDVVWMFLFMLIYWWGNT